MRQGFFPDEFMSFAASLRFFQIEHKVHYVKIWSDRRKGGLLQIPPKNKTKTKTKINMLAMEKTLSMRLYNETS